jgi:hypothetical protein
VALFDQELSSHQAEAGGGASDKDAGHAGLFRSLVAVNDTGVLLGAQSFLEELDLPYTAHAIDVIKDEQFAPDFLKVSPTTCKGLSGINRCI